MMEIFERKLDMSMIRKLEQIEIDYWMKYYQHPGSIESYGTVISNAFVGAIPSLDILAMNRVIGLGSYQDISVADLESIIKFYEKAGSKRFFVQLVPYTLKNGTIETLKDMGFKHHNNWVKLYRSNHQATFDTNPDLHIKKINNSDATLYGELIFMSFDWEDSRLPEWLASTVGKAGYSNYIVYYQNKAIAAGALFTGVGMASVAFAGTLDKFRGLGAQQLLLKTRINEAIEKGAKFITAETAESTVERPIKSFENMLKVGFGTAYLRQNWLYEF